MQANIYILCYLVLIYNIPSLKIPKLIKSVCM